MRLNKLTKIIKISMKHIVSFLEKHPELGVAPKLSPNSTLNDEQVVAVIDFYKNEKNRPTISYQEDSDNEFEITEEQTALKISTVKFYPNIKVVGQIDLDALNQSTRPKKKTKEEKRKDREEKEKLRQEQRKKIKEDTIKAIRKNIDDKRIENNEKEATSKGTISSPLSSLSPAIKPCLRSKALLHTFMANCSDIKSCCPLLCQYALCKL